MKRLIIPLAILGMLALLVAAMAWDCVRLAADGRNRVALADAELQRHETRLVKLLSDSSKTSPDVQSAISAVREADSVQARHDAYDRLVAAFRKTMEGQIDPNNPLDRKFMDDVAGSINRHQIAQKQYDDEAAAYQGFLISARGSVAQIFSSQARADPKSGD